MIFGLTLAFVLTAIMTITGALAAALLKNLVHCALSLTVTFAGLALLYLQLDAQFAGFSQILVYIGAVAILVVFAILLTRGAGIPEYRGFSGSWIFGLVLACATFAVIAWAILKSFVPSVDLVAAPEVTVQSIGLALMSTYVLPLEIVAILLTVALIGAVIVAMPESRTSKADAGEGSQQ